MGERLRPRDLAFLTGETLSAPRHNATIQVFEPGPDGFSYDSLLALVEDRIAFAPRYGQRLVTVPGHLANPVWVDDPDIDLGYHLRRSALPRPGTMAQLRDLVARIVSRPLDRHRPLWEIYVVEGLEHGRVALLHKTHQVLVDGIETVDLSQVLLDDTPGRAGSAHTETTGTDPVRSPRVPREQPPERASATGLLVDAVRDTLTSPTTAGDTLRGVAGAAARGVGETRTSLNRLVGGLAGRPAVRLSPLEGPLSFQRRVVTVDTELAAYRRIREVHGGSINDAVLATVTGGLRGWLMARGESMRQVRALVPVSVIDADLEATSLGSAVAAHHVALPVGETSPVVRLHQVSYSFAVHRDTGRGVAAERLAGIAGFAPTTFHAIGSRVAAAQGSGAQLTVTNVPGPQTPLYAAGARLLASYPVPPLLPGQTLAVGVTSYDGRVCFGITADRDLVPDADLLGQCVGEALEELLDTTGPRPRTTRGRLRSARRSRTQTATPTTTPTPQPHS